MIANNFGFQGGASGSIPATSNYGLWTQIEDGNVVQNTDIETTILGVGLGTLSVPENIFVMGDTFHLKICGKINAKNNAQLTINLHSNGIDLGSTGIMTLSTTTTKIWEFTADFTIRQIGGVGVAQLLTNGMFNYQADASSNYEGVNFMSLNNTTFDTTIVNTLDVMAQWGVADPLNAISSVQMVLTKTY